MTFAVALPWWGYVLAFSAALACAWWAYARLGPIATPLQRWSLTGLRALTLVIVVAAVLRPVRFVEAPGAGDATVAILVDASRSMRLADEDGPRIDRAKAIVDEVQRGVASRFRTDVFTFGETLARVESSQFAADARRSDLSGALSTVADRFAGRPLAAVVVVSDGGDTAAEEADSTGTTAPVFTVGVGRATGAADREIVNLTAGEPLLTGSSIDLSVSVTTTGSSTEPIELRLEEDGRPLESRRVKAPADGAPVYEVFTVSPAADRATVYSVTTPALDGEITADNNTRSVLVPPRGRPRRLLLIEGAPGFEHTFLKRALARDPALEVDSVVRKGRNEQGRDTFFIHAAASRTTALTTGYPITAPQLFEYDAVLFGNIGAEFFSRDQLAMTTEFVARRGGGLLVFGARSFETTGLAGTPLEQVLPIDISDRRVPTLAVAGPTPPSGLSLTADGVGHAATRVANTAEQNMARWAQLPVLSAVAAVGGPRPGAIVLAAAATPGQASRPLIVTQRDGQGRALVFAGEASWRWRMMRPSSDTTYELVWRQLARWVSSAASDRVEIAPPATAIAGGTDDLTVTVRDEAFQPTADATVLLHVKEPGGAERSIPAALVDPGTGRYRAAIRFAQPGVYTVTADVRRGNDALGRATRAVLVGGVDVEMAQPRLNEAVLRRVAESAGGQYLSAAEVGRLPELLSRATEGQRPREMRDLWHNGFVLATIMALLGLEWALRRRLGML